MYPNAGQGRVAVGTRQELLTGSDMAVRMAAVGAA